MQTPEPLPDLVSYDVLPDPAEYSDSAWLTAVDQCKLGSTATGSVVARAPFGVFVDLDGLALGLINLPHMPARIKDGELQWPEIGDRISGRVWAHDQRTRQVRITAENPISVVLPAVP